MRWKREGNLLILQWLNKKPVTFFFLQSTIHRHTNASFYHKKTKLSRHQIWGYSSRQLQKFSVGYRCAQLTSRYSCRKTNWGRKLYHFQMLLGLRAIFFSDTVKISFWNFSNSLVQLMTMRFQNTSPKHHSKHPSPSSASIDLTWYRKVERKTCLVFPLWKDLLHHKNREMLARVATVVSW